MVISEFSSKTVANVTGVTARQLDYWADTGFIIPSVQAGAGRGKVRLYDFVDLLQVKVAKQLGDAGISLQKMRKAVDVLRSFAPQIDRPLARFEFISDGRDVFVVNDDELLLSITNRIGQFYWRLNVGDIARQLASDVARLAQVEEVAVRPGDRELPAVIYRDLDSNWWIGRCTTLPGCVTQGKNREEALTLLADAAAEYLAASGGDAASGTA